MVCTTRNGATMTDWKFVLLQVFLAFFLPLQHETMAQGEAIELVILSENITIDAGESALLVCVGFNLDNSSVDITWKRNGEAIFNSTSSILSDEDLVHRDRLFKQSFLQLCDLQHVDSGSYSCYVSNGTVSVNGTIEVTVTNVLELAVITNSTTMAVGENLLLVCVGYGQPSINITWSKEGQVISNGSDAHITEDETSVGGRVFTQSFLRLCALQTCHSGSYNCTINNGISTVRSSTYVSVEGDSARIVSITNNTSIYSGESVKLTCVGHPAQHVDISWSYKGHSVSNANDVSINEEQYQLDGNDYKRSVLQYLKMNQQDEGTRTCIVSNGCYSTEDNVEVAVNSILESAPQPSEGFSIIWIILAAVAILVILVLAVSVVLCVLVRKYKKKKRQIPDKLGNRQPDCIYDEIGKSSAPWEKSKDYDLDFVQSNSAYGVIENEEHIYMEADKL